MKYPCLLAPGVALAVSSSVAAELPRKMSLDLAKGVKLELVLIPAGKFMMGLPEDVRQAHSYPHIAGTPLHEVTITKPFYMGIYEITQEQYQAVTGKSPTKAAFKSPRNHGMRVVVEAAGAAN